MNVFPWQASIGAAVVDAEFVPNGQRITINGRTFDGPLHVVRKAMLKEISFVDNGADTATSACIHCGPAIPCRERSTYLFCVDSD